MKIWRFKDYIKIHPFLSQDEEAESQFAFFTIDLDGNSVYLESIDKDHQWEIEELEKYRDGLDITIQQLRGLSGGGNQ